MNLNQLRFAKAVAESGSFSRAAEHCCVTQPTLSSAIGQLEDELGGLLFRRTTRSVSVTPFGKQMLPLIAAVLEARDELLSASRAFREPAHTLIRVGLSPLVDVRLVNRLLAPYVASHPQVEIFFKQCFLDDMERRLEAATVDLAIVPRGLPPNGRSTLRLYDEPLYFLPREIDGAAPLPPGPSLLGTHEREQIILTSGCGLSDTIGELYRQARVTLKRYPGQALSYRVVEDWASLGIGAGILPRSKLSGSNTAARPLSLNDGSAARVSYEAQWFPEITQARHLVEFIEHLDGAATALRSIDPRL